MCAAGAVLGAGEGKEVCSPLSSGHPEQASGARALGPAAGEAQAAWEGGLRFSQPAWQIQGS